MIIVANKSDFQKIELYLFGLSLPKKTDITVRLVDGEEYEDLEYTTVNVNNEWLVSTL